MLWPTYSTNLSRNTVLGQLLTYWICHIVVRDAFEAEEFAEVATKPLKALLYDTPG
ncbi:hypothetical protein HanRHA438_Chr09g0414531 [Helianthus annuus]|uniref:Uncharacterized protein n=1 Tax=Helianthus annuus TaxID=4232 RepID=A0A9K3I809_HELAN|nr:hypothetical protein HanXRQr2_Chr09g0402661 [Helianthus annuus]KAJ0527113.1 hypothetical protein HanHA300_Chr09g0330571 [Helianthus annuus]KAJ0535732.1 hypothetical protein HanIR_Chr09g0433821 [Helianthus annuus]KAJ0543512.1 hypothetical protein HanHA89_Chr09g0351511 [Helianthus annuus]KAJ0708564.1 hypothetical protein HanLR1_Chr09g0330801 [Helianthus annuus]